MERYRTRQYVALTWVDARQLAGLDRTPVEEIIHVSDVELIHRAEWWAWWSDLKITTAFGLPQDLQPQGLSPDAAQLISEAWESDVIEPECGWPLLAEIRQILNRTEIWRGEQRGQYQPETWERLRVVLEADREAILYPGAAQEKRATNVLVIGNTGKYLEHIIWFHRRQFSLLSDTAFR